MREEVRGWEHGTGSESHVLRDHGRVVVATTPHIRNEFGVRQGVRIDGLQLPMFGDGGWLAVFVPVEAALAKASAHRPVRRAESAGGFPRLELATPDCSRNRSR